MTMLRLWTRFVNHTGFLQGDEPMHLLEAFELDIQPGTPDNPAAVKIALQKAIFDPSGRVFVTPECSSFEELEGQINSLQDDLDELRERARRAFQVTT
jgi:hypothetical protein